MVNHLDGILFPRKAIRWLLWLLPLAAWTTALLTPQPVQLADAVLPDSLQFPSFKLLHVGAYAVLAVLAGWLRAPPRVRWLLLVFLSAHAMGTEYFQRFVPLRTPSWGDVGWDHLGLLLGLALSWKWWWQRPEAA
jgi:VanZ family protein